ncbi:hypothetical protein D3877_10150 [Azospirillum cavernae]|uniref:Uncharacterized protein n=1 Tax=Azospirillum cavernae TaxID=2320860 RepID=A0A418W471_9PROT|nr:hypothetical protein D3877_10150 [Azospirillum cavernae]
MPILKKLKELLFGVFLRLPEGLNSPLEDNLESFLLMIGKMRNKERDTLYALSCLAFFVKSFLIQQLMNCYIAA